MKIGIVLYPTFGGSGVVATELGKALAKKGHEIHFITYSQPVRLGGFTENVFYHEVSVSDYPLFDFQPYETELASKMVDVVKYEKLDLIHVHYAIPHASAAFMAKQILKTQGITIPYVTTLHGTDITLVGRDPSFEPVITFCINESDAVTAVSESLKKDTLKHFNYRESQTAWRAKSFCAGVSQASFDQTICNKSFKILRSPCLHTSRYFFGKKFYQQIRHGLLFLISRFLGAAFRHGFAIKNFSATFILRPKAQSTRASPRRLYIAGAVAAMQASRGRQQVQ